MKEQIFEEFGPEQAKAEQEAGNTFYVDSSSFSTFIKWVDVMEELPTHGVSVLVLLTGMEDPITARFYNNIGWNYVGRNPLESRILTVKFWSYYNLPK